MFHDSDDNNDVDDGVLSAGPGGEYSHVGRHLVRSVFRNRFRDEGTSIRTSPITTDRWRLVDRPRRRLAAASLSPSVH